MLTTVDTKRGLVQTTWSNVRDRVKKVEPEFTKLVDSLNPNKKFPVFLAYFPYGALKGDTISSFIPLVEGGHYRLSDPSAPQAIKKHLGYGIGSSPFGMVLEKNFEYYFDLKQRSITKPQKIATPGTFFPIDRLFNNIYGRVYSPNGLLSATSGSRSAFMLPSVSRDLNHSYLQRDLGITSDVPMTPYQHWEIFKEITTSPEIQCDWRSCLIYFSENWINKIMNDDAWLKLRAYLYEKAWCDSAYSRCSDKYYDLIFSEIRHNRNLRLTPHMNNLVRHIFKILLGKAVGYSPLTNDNSLPLDTIQKAYVDSYSLKNYWPTIMAPDTFILEKTKHPLYYSLQHTSSASTQVNTTAITNTLAELRELKRILRIYFDELSTPDSICSDTILNDITKSIKLSYFHNKHDQHRSIQSSKLILDNDARFKKISPNLKQKGAIFSSDAPFLRGCISMESQ
ncbi:MAG: hypothetical protein P1U63_02400 [Coxiellaceae bacterium]|nr:hypothetical protein [Coxiellaceae bacterium]